MQPVALAEQRLFDLGSEAPFSAANYQGVCRSLWNWVQLDGTNLIGVGTNLDLSGLMRQLSERKKSTGLGVGVLRLNGQGEKSVQAPLALPNDVQELAFGPDAVLRSQNPQQIRRVGLELPNAAFTEQAVLQQEMRLGARYPEGRTGNIDASIITGQGVQALLGAFDSQIKAGQQVIAQTFEDVLSLCMRIDEKIFPMDKTVRGVNDGAPYELKYNPAKDIKGDYTVEVRYGLMAGLDPSRALIFSLQAMGGDLVSREFVMSELPWALNVSKEQERIDVQRMRDNLNKAIESSAAALPV